MGISVAKQMRYGKACVRCKAYFVTGEAEERICPWCKRIEMGSGVEKAYEAPEQKVL